MKTALHWSPEEGKKVRCALCRHGCLIPDGKAGLCRVRKNVKGALETITYGRLWGFRPSADPIEKKPLFHFMPGTRTLSLGTIGCNFRCAFCQNWQMSNEWSEADTREIGAEEVPGMARTLDCQSVSWTYNEPTMWYEFTLDASRLARKAGLPTVYVTNGYIAEEPLRELSKSLDAMNIDVKAFSERFYSKLTGARLSGVLDTCALARELGIFVEITYLIIPGENDSPDELKAFSRWVALSMSPETPVHFSAFHPDYRMRDRNGTPASKLALAKKIARSEGLCHVYIGNVGHTEDENTRCPKCGALAIERHGFAVSKNMAVDGKCPSCSADLNIVVKPAWMG